MQTLWWVPWVEVEPPVRTLLIQLSTCHIESGASRSFHSFEIVRRVDIHHEVPFCYNIKRSVFCSVMPVGLSFSYVSLDGRCEASCKVKNQWVRRSLFLVVRRLQHPKVNHVKTRLVNGEVVVSTIKRYIFSCNQSRVPRENK